MPTGGVDYNTRTKEQLIELIEMIQRDRYKLEEENRKLREQLIQRNMQNDNLGRKNKELEEENRKLKESLDIATKCSSKEEDGIIRLSEENKSLKNELMEDMKTETKLNEEIRNLKSELSKFSEAYKKYRDYEKEELAESCYDFARENDKLRAEVKDLVERNIELDKKYTFVLSKLRR